MARERKERGVKGGRGYRRRFLLKYSSVLGERQEALSVFWTLTGLVGFMGAGWYAPVVLGNLQMGLRYVHTEIKTSAELAQVWVMDVDAPEPSRSNLPCHRRERRGRLMPSYPSISTAAPIIDGVFMKPTSPLRFCTPTCLYLAGKQAIRFVSLNALTHRGGVG
ncbi:hypothetical protein VTG60DRAFT_194 [Thermothelomyces hinnuleus]